jgi:starch synthase
MLSRTSRSHRDDIGVLIGLNEPMARRIVAASEFTLMPRGSSLTKMQAQRYGALPIAHATGGLADTSPTAPPVFCSPATRRMD